jgi:hypothetical protein
MPDKKKWYATKKDYNETPNSRENSAKGKKIAAGAILGTVAAGVMADPKLRKKAGEAIKKGASAVKGAFSKKGTYSENPKTGKMEREKTAKPSKKNKGRAKYQ